MGRLFLSALLIAALAACAPHAAQQQAATGIEQAQAAVADVITPPAVTAQASIAETIVPAMLAAQTAVQDVVPPPQTGLPSSSAVTPAAVALIVRWEVTSEPYYARRLQRPIWPGGNSGVTWGVGYDGGQQTRASILADWHAHPDAEALSTTSGFVAEHARIVLPSYHHVITPFALAETVFRDAVLPKYVVATRRALGPDFERLPAHAQDALVSLGYNRGWMMAGDRNSEKRAIRDRCVPAGDAQCIAEQLRAMCRIWAHDANGDGLCRRRNAEARLAVSA
jgi:hypothetical protein